MLLTLSHVAHFFGQRLIFKDVSLTIEPGTVTLLGGSNGAGKSTLLKIMAGLLRPSSGSVTPGRTRSGNDAAIGYLGHHTFIYPELTARENLAFWAAMHGRKLHENDCRDILSRVELTSFAEEKAGAFSRGMAQRLNLARVFLLAPDILLLDEPGTGLDTRSTAILHSEIASARASGAAVIWISHSLATDMLHADKVALLEKRKLAFYGSTEAWQDFCAADTVFRPASETPVMASGGELC